MKLSVQFAPVGIPAGALAGRPVLVLDILRATTTMVAAQGGGVGEGLGRVGRGQLRGSGDVADRGSWR